MQKIFKVTGYWWCSVSLSHFYVAATDEHDARMKADKKTGYESFDIKEVVEVTAEDVLADSVYYYAKNQ